MEWGIYQQTPRRCVSHLWKPPRALSNGEDVIISGFGKFIIRRKLGEEGTLLQERT